MMMMMIVVDDDDDDDDIIMKIMKGYVDNEGMVINNNVINADGNDDVSFIYCY